MNAIGGEIPWVPSHTINLFIFGESGVGKTSLTRNFLRRTFRHYHVSTLINEVYVVKLVTSVGNVELRIHDTVGQESLFIERPEYDSMSAAMIVYNMSSMVTTKSIPSIVRDIRRRKLVGQDSCPPIMIVGTHVDKISVEKAQNRHAMMANKYPEVGHATVSNMLDNGVQEGVFQFIIENVSGFQLQIYHHLTPIGHFFLDRLTGEEYEPVFSVSLMTKKQIAVHQARCADILLNLKLRNGLDLDERIPVALLKALTVDEKELLFTEIEEIQQPTAEKAHSESEDD